MIALLHHRQAPLAALAGLAFAAAVATIPTAATAGPPLYHIEKIRNGESGKLKAHQATSVNNDGVVVGWSRRPDFGYVPFIFERHRPTALAGPSAGAMYGWQAINLQREVMGSIEPRAYWWDSSGHPTDLHPLLPCAGTSDYSEGAAINDAGAGVGRYTCSANNKSYFGSFLYRDGATTDLGFLKGGSDNAAHGINNLGQVVGGASTLNADGDQVTRAYLWQDGKIQDLGALAGFTNSEARDINDAGYIIVRAYNALVDNRGFVVRNGRTEPLPTCAGNGMFPIAINNRGQVVGNVYIRDYVPALIQQGQCYFLQALLDDSGEGWRNLWVNDINDDGVMVGFGNKGAFIATPLK